MSDENLHENFDYNCTPPPNRKIRNPFDRVLIGKLHMPICSPGMCKIYKKQVKNTFVWEIEQASTLDPADIVACTSQFEPTPDPALEKIAEEATEKFFSQELVLPSPHESSKKVRPLLEPNISITDSDDMIKREVVTNNVSCQTVLTLPPVLPDEVESVLKKYYTYTQDQKLFGEFEMTANGSLRKSLYFEEHSDIEPYDSEQTDEESHHENRPPSNYELHSPVTISPSLNHGLLVRGMARNFGTPLQNVSTPARKSGYRSKILNSVDIEETCFSPIFKTPQRMDQVYDRAMFANNLGSPICLTENSIRDENRDVLLSSPEMEVIATCLECVSKDNDTNKGDCFCKVTPNKSLLLRRSTSMKESPRWSKKRSGSFSDECEMKSYSSMTSLHRSRSVQKLDFSFDMSVDGFFHDSQERDLDCHYSGN